LKPRAKIEYLLERLAERRVAAETHDRAACVLSKLEAVRQVGTANVRLTDAIVREALPRQRTHLLWDRDVKGFGVRIYPSGTKTFVVTYRPAGLLMKEWYTIGRSTVISASRAREEARTILAKNRLGGEAVLERLGHEIGDLVLPIFENRCDLTMTRGLGSKSSPRAWARES